MSGRAGLAQPSLTREIIGPPDPTPSFCCPAATLLQGNIVRVGAGRGAAGVGSIKSMQGCTIKFVTQKYHT